MTGIVYVDSSAIVKLVVDEPESRALREYLEGVACVASAIARTEVVRAVLGRGDHAVDASRKVLGGFALVGVSDTVLDAAGSLAPVAQRSLDAIHVATAMALRGEVQEIVTYDKRMQEAALALGVRVASPH